LAAVPARYAGLEGDTLADAFGRHVRSHGDDPTTGLVTEDQGIVDHEVTDPTVLVVVHVGSAHADRGHLYEHLVGARSRHRAFFDANIGGRVQNADPHAVRNGGHGAGA
jgi:hypothetical protein